MVYNLLTTHISRTRLTCSHKQLNITWVGGRGEDYKGTSSLNESVVGALFISSVKEVKHEGRKIH